MPSSDKIYIDQPNLDLTLTLREGEHVRLWVINRTVPARHQIRVELLSADARVEIYGLVTDGSLETNVRHMVPDTSSQQLIKYVLDGNAVGNYVGQLYIAPDAQRTDAQQTNRNLLLSDSARMNTRPQLEIYADDVKASHGASTGQLDTSALFYMQQRCIDPVSARAMLVEAFMNEILDTVPAQS